MKEIGVRDFTLEDLKNLRIIAESLSTRSASLASVGIATLLNKMAITPVTVGVDGSLYRYHPKYKEIMSEKIRGFTDPKIEVRLDIVRMNSSELIGLKFWYQFQLMLSEDGSGRGAALVAAVLVCHQSDSSVVK